MNANNTQAHTTARPHFLPDDRECLRVLALLYYIKSGVIALHGLCLIPCLVLLGDSIRTGDTSTALACDVMRFGQAALTLCLGLFLLTVLFAGFTWLAGRNLSAFRNYRLCIAAALVSCLFFPLGTVLGLFSLGILTRPSIKARFVHHRHR